MVVLLYNLRNPPRTITRTNTFWKLQVHVVFSGLLAVSSKLSAYQFSISALWWGWMDVALKLITGTGSKGFHRRWYKKTFTPIWKMARNACTSFWIKFISSTITYVSIQDGPIYLAHHRNLIQFVQFRTTKIFEKKIYGLLDIRKTLKIKIIIIYFHQHLLNGAWVGSHIRNIFWKLVPNLCCIR